MYGIWVLLEFGQGFFLGLTKLGGESLYGKRRRGEGDLKMGVDFSSAFWVDAGKVEQKKNAGDEIFMKYQVFPPFSPGKNGEIRLQLYRAKKAGGFLPWIKKLRRIK